MRTTLKLSRLAIFGALLFAYPKSARAHDQVFHVQSANCGPKLTRFSQSGFRATVQGQVGLVTALHGVVGCGRIYAVQEPELLGSYVELTPSKVSVPHDAVFLTSPTLLEPQFGSPLNGASTSIANGLKVVGYPQESQRQLEHPVALFPSPRRTLSNQFTGTDTERSLAQRNSPSVNIEILMVQGLLQNGYSGAPVLTSSGSVLGIANGGLAQGFAQINWAIPFVDIPWQAYNPSDAEILRLSSADASSLFHSPWTSQAMLPGGGATVRGRIFYSGKALTDTTRAYAAIELVESATRRALPIDYSYSNTTGDFTISRVPPGKYTPFVRVDAGYPFSAESGGDYFSRISGLNPDIVVAPHDNDIQANLQVVQSIHLKRPVDNQSERTSADDPPEQFYGSDRSPSAEVFEWEPVPNAALYKVTILMQRAFGEPALKRIEMPLGEPRFFPGLAGSPPGTEYAFYVEAFNTSNQMIGTFTNYYKNGNGSWLRFRVVPRPGEPPAAATTAATVVELTQELGKLAGMKVPLGATPVRDVRPAILSQGQQFEDEFQLQPGRCYTVLGLGMAPVLEVNLQIVAHTPAGMAPVLAIDNGTGPLATIGERSNCFKWAYPIPAPVKIVLSVTQGAGLVGLQLWSK